MNYVPANDTRDFPVSLLLFFIIGISINFQENECKIGRMSWPHWQYIIFEALAPRHRTEPFPFYPHSIKGLSFASLGDRMMLILTLTEALCFVPEQPQAFKMRVYLICPGMQCNYKQFVFSVVKYGLEKG